MTIRLLAVSALPAMIVSAAMAVEPIDVGLRLEPLVDDYLIAATSGVSHTLCEPAPREVAIVHDQPWEGNVCTYHTVFRDGDLYRMYYRGAHYNAQTKKEGHPEVVCYAESKDGIHWTKPELGLVEFQGSRKNNIILDKIGTHNFAPFKDANPACKPDERYKALASNESGEKGLVPFKSADGIRWTLMQTKPVITKGAFDSQNLAFWDATRQRYVEYHRHFHDHVRDIMTCTSTDFLHWTEPEWLKYPGAATEQLYTNQITPYDRAPHIFFGFPMRYVASRQSPTYTLTGHSADMQGMTDGLIMTSRDGLNFHRWGEAFIRPGLDADCWVTRNRLTAWGIVHTKPIDPDVDDELSIYSTEGYYQGDSCRLRRFTLRTDGFASYGAAYRPGCLLTKPLRFAGKELLLNFSTAAAGWIRVEIRDAEGKPIPGFALADCPEIIGDHLERAVAWKGGSDLSALAGKPVRLLIAMKEADLFALRFRGDAAEQNGVAQPAAIPGAPINAAAVDAVPADWCPAEFKEQATAAAAADASKDAKPYDLGSRRELFVDRTLVDSLQNAKLTLHRPTYAGVVARRDAPWEGVNTFGYVTVIKAGDTYKMYYRAYTGPGVEDGDPKETTCYAESSDGIHWVKPELGLFKVAGTKKNNVILANMAPYTHNFSPFLDSRPDVPADERYKAMGGTRPGGLAAFVSPDGIHWKKLRDNPVLVVGGVSFDSQNVSFWSESEKCYLAYFRLCPEGVRAIARATSNDFVAWSAPAQMKYGDQGTRPPENLYTNQTQAYFRAPHIYLATPARFMEGRRVLSEAEIKSLKLSQDSRGIEGDCSDACLMSTRGGDRYQREFMEGWIRPGMGLRNWMTRSNYPALGLIPTGPTELSLYVCRHNAQESVHMTRYTLRPDGFASVRANSKGGEMLTRPLTFTGKALEINFSTSAAGSVRVEIQAAGGKPIPGYALDDCPELYGDRLDQVVAWKQGSDVSRLAGQPIRLRFVLNDADLYAIRVR